jgi:hypothetical protein
MYFDDDNDAELISRCEYISGDDIEAGDDVAAFGAGELQEWRRGSDGVLSPPPSIASTR